MVVTRKIFLLIYPESFLNSCRGSLFIRCLKLPGAPPWFSFFCPSNFCMCPMADLPFYLGTSSWGLHGTISRVAILQLAILLHNCASIPCCLWSWCSSCIPRGTFTSLVASYYACSVLQVQLSSIIPSIWSHLPVPSRNSPNVLVCGWHPSQVFSATMDSFWLLKSLVLF